MDSVGRLVIPKRIRVQAGFEPGVPLTIRYIDGVVELQVAPTAVKLESKGRVTVIQPTQEMEEVLTAEVVAETLDDIREGGR
jgi:bifunctional DNA-binding transcriptional regulator/antitoxin component of YhaV-PrlF toxin-antitoxin module